MDYGWLGRAAFLLGRLDDAHRLGNLALENSPRHAGFQAHALHLLGDVAAHPDMFDAERSLTHYGKSLVLAEQRGMRPRVAHCHMGLGKLHHRLGQQERANEHLATATIQYREMDMRSYLEEAKGVMR
jgi:tetratricopeptide (TPR) repeat protein